ncbi:hypothetical protein BHM03_00059090 [Ensete ventricosum]|nr:hypothetical protein BHM03_00059090 [Ensete ventricosum]
MARPQEAAAYDQAARGSRLRLGRKGQPLATRPQGAAAHFEAARAATHAGASPARCCPRSAALTVGAAAHADGVQRRRLRRAATTVVAQ